ncbi:DUF4340 domain-containing protein [Treponema ruminis]|uniref:DUF4340 domain-containing protein n=1 Tax=Treponema ruminis TaxID=744515 RepID=A0A7W8G9A4_9SPIR|nr:DUF4340 domain-containing protein [Treponema ruminis]MBB5226086.1 hypothetical protein [Treponema ruminis]QSI03005.1 DUF4340 domain-containing protein [Treponema ruminis]
MIKNKLMLRKAILAGGVVLLALIYILQLIAGSRSSVKDFVIDKTFDTIEISSSENGSVNLKRYGDFWKVNDEEADSAKAKSISDSLISIKTLSVISKSASEDAIERYGFTDSQKITVKVSDNSKEYLNLEIGKDAAGGQQNYIRVNGKSEIYLASGALRQKCAVKAEELKKPVEEPKPEEAPAETAAPEVAPSV